MRRKSLALILVRCSALVGDEGWASVLPLMARGPGEPFVSASGILGLMAVWRSFYCLYLDIFSLRWRQQVMHEMARCVCRAPAPAPARVPGQQLGAQPTPRRAHACMYVLMCMCARACGLHAYVAARLRIYARWHRVVYTTCLRGKAEGQQAQAVITSPRLPQPLPSAKGAEAGYAGKGVSFAVACVAPSTGSTNRRTRTHGIAEGLCYSHPPSLAPPPFRALNDQTPLRRLLTFGPRPPPPRPHGPATPRPLRAASSRRCLWLP